MSKDSSLSNTYLFSNESFVKFVASITEDTQSLLLQTYQLSLKIANTPVQKQQTLDYIKTSDVQQNKEDNVSKQKVLTIFTYIYHVP